MELESQGRTMRLVLDKSNQILKEKLAAEILLHAKNLKSPVLSDGAIEQSLEGIVLDQREYETLMKRLGYGHKVDDTSRRLIEDIWGKLSQEQRVKLSDLFEFLCHIHNYIV